MKRYILSAEAQQDFQEIRAYYLKNANPRVARYVVGELTSTLRFLAATPELDTRAATSCVSR